MVQIVLTAIHRDRVEEAGPEAGEAADALGHHHGARNLQGRRLPAGSRGFLLGVDIGHRLREAVQGL